MLEIFVDSFLCRFLVPMSMGGLFGGAAVFLRNDIIDLLQAGLASMGGSSLASAICFFLGNFMHYLMPEKLHHLSNKNRKYDWLAIASPIPLVCGFLAFCMGAACVRPWRYFLFSQVALLLWHGYVIGSILFTY